MAELSERRKRKSDEFYVTCKCGERFGRGMASDYEITCPECEEVVIVRKFEPADLLAGDEKLK